MLLITLCLRISFRSLVPGSSDRLGRRGSARSFLNGQSSLSKWQSACRPLVFQPLSKPVPRRVRATSSETCQRRRNLRRHNSLGMTSYQTPCSGFWSGLQSLPSKWQRRRYVGDSGHFYAGVNKQPDLVSHQFFGSPGSPMDTSAKESTKERAAMRRRRRPAPVPIYYGRCRKPRPRRLRTLAKRASSSRN